MPVAKGNGYGFGVGRLAAQVARQWLGVDTLAVGTYDELPRSPARFDGDLLVLTPWRPFDAALEPTAPPTGSSTPSAGSTDLRDLLRRQPGRPRRARAADVSMQPARASPPRELREAAGDVRRAGRRAGSRARAAPAAGAAARTSPRSTGC